MAKGTVAHLKRCVYGTRDAGMIWEDCYAQVLVGMGFQRGIANPCCFHHPQRSLALVVHGNGFTCLGSMEDLLCSENNMKEAFEIKVRARLGGAADADEWLVRPGPLDVQQSVCNLSLTMRCRGVCRRHTQPQ